MQGVLTERSGDLVLARENGSIEAVRWSASQHRVQEDAGHLVVVDRFGTVIAREGDFVRLGGSEIDDGVWGICGMFEVGEAGAS